MSNRRGVDIEGRLDGIVWLDQLIVVPRSLAGRGYEVRIGDRPMLLTLPKDGPRELAMSEGDPPLAIPSFPRPPLAPELSPKIHVASGMTLPLPPQVFAVTALRLRWDDERLESSFGEFGATDHFAAALDVWVTTVGDWLAAWSGNVWEPVDRKGPPRFRVAAVHRPDVPAHGGGGRVPVVMMGQQSSTADEIRGAFAAASAGIHLPLPRRLLGEAAVLLARGATRESVIAACSAAEVALSDEARQMLIRNGASESDAHSVLKGVGGVVELYRVNAARRGGLPLSIGSVMANLAGPRNDAVHAGVELNEDVARRALQAAGKLVSMSTLPGPRAVISSLRVLSN